MYQKVGCDVKEESFRQFGIKRNGLSISHIKSDTFLFIMVLTSPNGKERRDAMRETWLSNIKTLDSSIIARFIVGIKELSQADIKNLEEENNIYSDILFFLSSKMLIKSSLAKSYKPSNGLIRM
ncbi:UDP-Gal betaGal beta 1,3-galactosyltransferase, polypeptide 6 [Desmophyllum pertusum]|uniref:UDP-Gal betaGal beta 1,3-galactosyltransferase, polypeptide 6 n=1 Tax=Desmophyllum pertusum TaxID=174260 RepID=A0A9X0CGL7_9CNID|nr:UDP-Gal betaGal beta 1,3-galactosyltransferase, polypeptide 6 [Desmophyllum pertusum]